MKTAQQVKVGLMNDLHYDGGVQSLNRLYEAVFTLNHGDVELLVVMGDINISHQDNDIGIGADNAKRWLRTGKCSFLPEEREWLEKTCAWGLQDTFRKQHPDVADRFSWFDYRSKGFNAEPKRGLRIDQIMATKPLYDLCIASGIDYQLRGMEKPSDHCPIWTEFNL